MPYPGGRRQLTAIFLAIQKQKGTAAAKAWYHKAQREGYVEKRDRNKRLRRAQ